MITKQLSRKLPENAMAQQALGLAKQANLMTG